MSGLREECRKSGGRRLEDDDRPAGPNPDDADAMDRCGRGIPIAVDPNRIDRTAVRALRYGAGQTQGRAAGGQSTVGSIELIAARLPASDAEATAITRNCIHDDAEFFLASDRAPRMNDMLKPRERSGFVP